MTTANAVTNALGHTISGSKYASEMGVARGATSQFVVSRPDKFGGHFLPEERLERMSGELSTVGALLSHFDDRVGLIARTLFESGVALTAPCQIMVCPAKTEPGKRKRTEATEVWTKNERFQVVKGRVYGHRIMNPSWRP